MLVHNQFVHNQIDVKLWEGLVLILLTVVYKSIKQCSRVETAVVGK